MNVYKVLVIILAVFNNYTFAQMSTFHWAKSANNDDVKGIRIDKNNNIIIAGAFSNTVTFDNRELIPSFYSDIYIAKYDAFGNVIQAYSSGTSGYDGVYDFTVDNANNVIVLCSYQSPPTFYDYYSYVSKFDSNGRALTEFILRGPTLYPNNIAADAQNNIYIAGSFSDSVVFGSQVLHAAGSYDGFLVKYSPAGSLLWAKSFGQEGFQHFVSDMIVTSTGEILYAEMIVSEFSNISRPITYSKFDLGGNLLSENTIACTGYPELYRIAEDKQGNIFLSGQYNGTIYVDSLQFTSDTTKFFLLKFTSDGDLLWFNDNAYNQYDKLSDIAIDNVGNIYAAGESLYSDMSQMFFMKFSPAGDVIWYHFYPTYYTRAVGVTINSLGEPIFTGTYTGDITFGDILLSSGEMTSIFTAKMYAPAITIPGPVDFGSVLVGTDSSIIINVVNNSLADLAIKSISITGIDSLNFSLSSGADLKLLPSSYIASIGIIFSPPDSGIKNAEIIIESDAVNGTAVINLTGRGELPALTVDLVRNNQSGDIITSVIPPAKFSFTSNFLYYKRTGENVYQSSFFQSAGQTYTASIPARYVSVRGIQYYITFSDGYSTITYPPQDPVSHPAFIPLKISEVQYPDNIPARKYQMISIPLLLDSPSVDSTFTDEFGTYNPMKWRLFEWNPADSSYAEYPDLINNVIPGKAFWLISSDTSRFTLKNAQSVSPENPFELSLNPGWNQVGNPYVFPVNWYNPEFWTADSLVSDPVGWDPDSSRYIFDQSLLEPWKGYWVYNENPYPVTHRLLPVEDFNVLEKGNKDITYDEKEFFIRLQTTVSSLNLKDQSYIGMLAPGKKRSIYKPPPINSDLKIEILSGGKYYSRNIRNISDDGESWDFIITSKHNNISLLIEQLSQLPGKFSIWLFDLSSKKSIPVYKNLVNISLPENGEGAYRIIVGTEEFAMSNSGNIPLVPAEFILYQNYPNPFNPATTIAYSIPKTGRIRLSLYDILGRELKLLVDEEKQPGIHEYKLNLSSFASGVYFYTVQFDKIKLTRKLVLTR